MRERDGTAWEVFATFLKLGCTSFGGPIAHLGYFRHELVERRRWLDDRAYGELVGLCQFLPGPASSQVGFALGLMRAGPLGGLAAWTAFTLPSAILMLGFALVSADLTGPIAAAAIHGLKIAAVAIVAQALVGMARALTPDVKRLVMAVVAAMAMVVVARPAAQIALIALGAIAGLIICPPGETGSQEPSGWRPSRAAGFACFGLFAILLVGLPLVSPEKSFFGLAGIFYRAGALVFGAGTWFCHCCRRDSCQTGWTTMSSWQVMALRKRCRGRYSPSQPILAGLRCLRQRWRVLLLRWPRSSCRAFW